MSILALDLGTRTGWAYGAAGVFVSGVFDLKGGRFEGGGMRFLRFNTLLQELHSTSAVRKIVYEEVRRHVATDAAHVYGGLQATLTSWAELEKIPYEGVPVGTIKKFWTGNGRANKGAMVAECVKRGIRVADDNEADAVALLHAAMEEVL